jgi:uncharacterized cupin superfamily protein
MEEYMHTITVEKIDTQEVEKRNLTSWGIWEKDVSEFDWAYTEEEHCYIIEGAAEVESEQGVVAIEKGDYVVFPAGLTCRWKVTRPIRKYYDFR